MEQDFEYQMLNLFASYFAWAEKALGGRKLCDLCNVHSAHIDKSTQGQAKTCFSSPGAEERQLSSKRPFTARKYYTQ